MVNRKRMARHVAGAIALAAALTVGSTVPARARERRTSGVLAAVGSKASTIPANAAMYISAIDGKPHHGDQAIIAVGQSVTLTFKVRFRSGGIADVSQDANTTFLTSPPRGTFSKNTWSPNPQDADKAFPIYGRYVS